MREKCSAERFAGKNALRVLVILRFPSLLSPNPSPIARFPSPPRAAVSRYSSYETMDYGTAATATRNNIEDNLFDKTNRSSSPPLLFRLVVKHDPHGGICCCGLKNGQSSLVNAFPPFQLHSHSNIFGQHPLPFLTSLLTLTPLLCRTHSLHCLSVLTLSPICRIPMI
jgi:hypothetical protein